MNTSQIPQNVKAPYVEQSTSHHSFCDEDSFYYIGDSCRNFWEYNLTSSRWRRYRLIGKVPIDMKIDKIFQISPLSNEVITYQQIKNRDFCVARFFHIRVDNFHCICHLSPIKIIGDVPSWPHFIDFASLVQNYLFFGFRNLGTTPLHVEGFSFKIQEKPEEKCYEIDLKQELKIDPNTARSCGFNFFCKAIYDELTKNVIFFGCNYEESYIRGKVIILSNKLLSYDTIKKRLKSFETIGADDGNYPLGSQEHFNINQYGRDVILTGGLIDRKFKNAPTNLWIYNIDSKKWRKGAFNVPICNHGSSITKDGCLLMFGGKMRYLTTFNTELRKIWLKPPSLLVASLEALKSYNSEVFNCLDGETLRLKTGKDVAEIFARFTNKKYLDECRRKSIEKFAFLPRTPSKNGFEYNNRFPALVWPDQE